jgi:light-regulated signal transduction histidine kinase (bacteriophytochrome)
MRAACEFLARLTSLHIAALEDRELLAVRASRAGSENALAQAMRDGVAEDDVLSSPDRRPTELLELVGAEGAAVVVRGNLRRAAGRRRQRSSRTSQRGSRIRESSGPFSTTTLGTLFPAALPASDVASGLLTFALPGTPQRRLLWFRPEITRTVRWGGDPAKAVSADSSERLRPRHSFALWQQEVRLHARPWTASDLEAADELRRHAIEADLGRQLASEQRAVRARDDLIAVVSHDLRTPLSAILTFTQAMLYRAPDGSGGSSELLRRGPERIQRSALHMKALIDDLLDLARSKRTVSRCSLDRWRSAS